MANKVMLAKCLPCLFKTSYSKSDSLNLTYLNPLSSVVNSASQIIVDIGDDDLKSPTPPSKQLLPDDRSRPSHLAPNRLPNHNPEPEVPARLSDRLETDKKLERPKTEGNAEKVRLKLRNLY
jgi:hypothetical protein